MRAGLAAGGWLLGVTASIVQREKHRHSCPTDCAAIRGERILWELHGTSRIPGSCPQSSAAPLTSLLQLLRIFLDMPETDIETLTSGGYVAHDVTIQDTVLDPPWRSLSTSLPGD